MTQRNIVLNIVLTLVTCGLFGLYWYYQIACDIYNTNNNVPTTPVITLLLFIVTGGIYGMFVYYKWGQALDEVRVSKGLPSEDKAILYLILAICQLSIVNMALIQNELNKMA